jgi:hypothetical protein
MQRRLQPFVTSQKMSRGLWICGFISVNGLKPNPGILNQSLLCSARMLPNCQKLFTARRGLSSYGMVLPVRGQEQFSLLLWIVAILTWLMRPGRGGELRKPGFALPIIRMGITVSSDSRYPHSLIRLLADSRTRSPSHPTNWHAPCQSGSTQVVASAISQPAVNKHVNKTPRIASGVVRTLYCQLSVGEMTDGTKLRGVKLRKMGRAATYPAAIPSPSPRRSGRFRYR